MNKLFIILLAFGIHTASAQTPADSRKKQFNLDKSVNNTKKSWNKDENNLKNKADANWAKFTK